ncbi:MAG: prepilin-type N-terminal cleavage/methylation domain-containing protein [Phycisphaerae bacterium]|nr:prepilin-type N-terminal cleavage/methylation domain-containing protein [Phycisphaerae bacterium]
MSSAYSKSEIRNPRSFTLIELLVVVAIIAVLVAILLPALAKARDSARVVECAANLRSLGQGIHVYAGDYSGFAPINHNFAGNFQHVAWSGGWWNFGMLFGLRMIETPKVFYCPSFGGTHDSDTPAYEAMKDYWRPSPGTSIIRIPYVYLVPHIFGGEQDPYGGGNFAYAVPGAVRIGNESDWMEPHGKFWTAQADNLCGYAVGSDLLYSMSDWTHAQREGFNVLFGEGAVRFSRSPLADSPFCWPGWWSGGTMNLHWLFRDFSRWNN